MKQGAALLRRLVSSLELRGGSSLA